jgi:threonine/homoserine/homoserine lactone efflux protein
VHEINFVLFCLTSLALIIVPGPDILYAATRAMSRGRWVGLISVAGICTGYVAHTVFALLGLSALIYASEFLFTLIKYAGAAYLCYLGLKTVLSKDDLVIQAHSSKLSNWQFFFQGMTTSLVNPKGILFFFSFLPQFIHPEAGQVSLQIFVLGCLFALLCAGVYGSLAWLAGSFGERVLRVPRFAKAIQWISGSIMMALGLRLLIPERR